MSRAIPKAMEAVRCLHFGLQNSGGIHSNRDEHNQSDSVLFQARGFLVAADALLARLVGKKVLDEEKQPL